MKKLLVILLFAAVLVGCSVNKMRLVNSSVTKSISESATATDEKLIDRPDVNDATSTFIREVGDFYGLKSAFLQTRNTNGISLVIKDKFENNVWIAEDTVRVKVNKILPSEVFFRELKKIPGTDEYLGIYVKDYTVDERNFIDVFDESSILITCPDQIGGQTSIFGEYHLFLYKNDKIIGDKLIPVSDGYKNEDGINKQTFSLINTKINNLLLYNKAAFITGNDYEKVKDKYKLERTELINFADYTGDGSQHEFIMVGFYISCGHEERLIAGFDQGKNEIIIYPITNDLIADYASETVGKELIYWRDNFIPNNKGEVDYIWNCGDHGSLTESKKKFAFNKQRKIFELISTSERKCE
jgi:hypothetical protein